MGGAMSEIHPLVKRGLVDLNSRLRKVENTNIMLVAVAVVMTFLNVVIAARVLSMMAILGLG
jgi:type IV secretory pathway component VirB8